MKKISVLLTAGLLFCSSTTFLTAKYNPNLDFSTQFDSDDDDFAIDNSDLNNISLENKDSSNTIHRGPGSSADAIYALFSLLDGNGAYQNAMLNLPIYQHTSLIRNRPILEYPYTLTYGFDIKNDNSLSLMVFLNRFENKNYTQDSTTLNSYFLLANPARVQVLEYIDNIIGNLNLDNMAASLALFDPAKVQENRLGGVLESHALLGKWNLMVQLPILYAERNLYLTNKEKSAITLSSLGGMLKTDGVSENDFVYQHIVMDQVGISDLKFKAMYEMHSSDHFDLDLGGFMIFPTATPFVQGIVGTWIPTNNNRAYLDLTTLTIPNLTPENQDEIANFFLAAIDKLSSNILNCPLGNNGHVVLAPSLNFDWYINQNWQFSNDFSAQFALPSQEQRFYQLTQSENDFLTAYNAAFAAGAVPFAYFVNTELQNLFFPFVFPTIVYPGTVFNCTNQFVYTDHDWDFYIGSNFWYQGAESITPLNNAHNPANPQNFTFEYSEVGAAKAAQEKLFVKINLSVEQPIYSWSLSAYGDITVWNTGIGNDFTLGVCLDCKF
ncbi:MAG: hypothetical protein JO129_00815 [Candidatus Dependentiae bacterium]|nr:hypothetical protein [Candidatus Dependentiae bacterium]